MTTLAAVLGLSGLCGVAWCCLWYLTYKPDVRLDPLTRELIWDRIVADRLRKQHAAYDRLLADLFQDADPEADEAWHSEDSEPWRTDRVEAHPSLTVPLSRFPAVDQEAIREARANLHQAQDDGA